MLSAFLGHFVMTYFRHYYVRVGRHGVSFEPPMMRLTCHAAISIIFAIFRYFSFRCRDMPLPHFCIMCAEKTLRADIGYALLSAYMMLSVRHIHNIGAMSAEMPPAPRAAETTLIFSPRDPAITQAISRRRRHAIPLSDMTLRHY